MMTKTIRRDLEPRSPARQPDFKLPAGTCDCHIHAFGPLDSYPAIATRDYDPPEARIRHYERVFRPLGVSRAVFVQPSIYGSDNSALLAALSETGLEARGIAVLSEPPGEAELQRLHKAGVRGLRLNAINSGGSSADRMGAFAKAIAPFDWHLDLQIRAKDLPALVGRAADCPVPLVIDHFGRPNFDDGDDPAASLIDLIETDKVWVKLSAPYRLGAGPSVRESTARLAQKLASIRPDRLLWASDWPHTEMFETMPDEADLIDAITEWIPDKAALQMILVAIPVRFYFS